jgi:predicted nucleic acid-binding protein
MRVVIDTNVMVSAVLGGSVGAVLDHWRLGRFTLVVTDAIVREYLEVLRRPKFAPRRSRPLAEGCRVPVRSRNSSSTAMIEP